MSISLQTSPGLPQTALNKSPSNQLPVISPTKKIVVSTPFDQKLTFYCKFCGGKSCKHENWMTYPESAIKGLNSDWISNTILATQRPSSRIIKEYDIIKQFKDNGINAIFNLQEPGEHPFCGDGIHASSGFSYHPEEFYDNGIYFFNFGWEDMTATSTDVVIKILKQMSFSLANGNKVAVHCHAGRGRTGLIIAAWLIYNDNMTAKEAIKHLRSRRKGAIQKKSQEKVLYDFEAEVKASRVIFFNAPKYGLGDYLFHQKKLYPLSSASAERYVPKIVLVTLERMETLLRGNICRGEDVLKSFYSLNEKQCFKEPWGTNNEKNLRLLKDRFNGGNWEVSDIEDPRYLAQILLDFLDNFALSPIETRFVNAISSNIHGTMENRLSRRVKDQFFKSFDRKEFFLLECFARFFATVIAVDGSIADMINRTALRVCISLVSARKKLDRLFLKRSLIAEHNEDDQATHLKIFLVKWIQNFNEQFSKTFEVYKSVLKIDEKKIKENLIKKGWRLNSYLTKVLDSQGSIKEEKEEEKSPTIPDVPDLDQDDSRSVSVSTPRNIDTDKKKDDLRIQIAERQIQAEIIKQNLRNVNDSPDLSGTPKAMTERKATMTSIRGNSKHNTKVTIKVPQTARNNREPIIITPTNTNQDRQSMSPNSKRKAMISPTKVQSKSQLDKPSPNGNKFPQINISPTSFQDVPTSKNTEQSKHASPHMKSNPNATSADNKVPTINKPVGFTFTVSGPDSNYGEQSSRGGTLITLQESGKNHTLLAPSIITSSTTQANSALLNPLLGAPSASTIRKSLLALDDHERLAPNSMNTMQKYSMDQQYDNFFNMPDEEKEGDSKTFGESMPEIKEPKIMIERKEKRGKTTNSPTHKDRSNSLHEVLLRIENFSEAEQDAIYEKLTYLRTARTSAGLKKGKGAF